mmetsp:Transcript_30282/g.76932  ORF Transcript_30282/g.76932 Transcript_30282/m.76932 type:complete len:269 (+) Transcript_30282:240-1046(+)
MLPWSASRRRTLAKAMPRACWCATLCVLERALAWTWRCWPLSTWMTSPSWPCPVTASWAWASRTWRLLPSAVSSGVSSRACTTMRCRSSASPLARRAASSTSAATTHRASQRPSSGSQWTTLRMATGRLPSRQCAWGTRLWTIAPRAATPSWTPAPRAWACRRRTCRRCARLSRPCQHWRAAARAPSSPSTSVAWSSPCSRRTTLARTVRPCSAPSSSRTIGSRASTPLERRCSCATMLPLTGRPSASALRRPLSAVEPAWVSRRRMP